MEENNPHAPFRIRDVQVIYAEVLSCAPCKFPLCVPPNHMTHHDRPVLFLGLAAKQVIMYHSEVEEERTEIKSWQGS